MRFFDLPEEVDRFKVLVFAQRLLGLVGFLSRDSLSFGRASSELGWLRIGFHRFCGCFSFLMIEMWQGVWARRGWQGRSTFEGCLGSTRTI
jgi:hypothetical protein